jgi:NAD+ synthase
MREEIDKLVEWIAQFVSSPTKSVVLGLSGGIDSAVVLALCVKALGKDNVKPFIMPYGSFSRNHTKDAIRVADKFDAKWEIVPIDSVVQAARFTMGDESDMLTEANFQARTRMMFLYAFARINKALVVGTTNKTELLLGYFTKWGDGAADFEPIADFYKTEVIELAKSLAIPKEIIGKPPTAGLWPGQTDENELGASYVEIDGRLQTMEAIPGDPPNPDDAISMNVVTLRRTTEHKRHMPPIYRRES